MYIYTSNFASVLFGSEIFSLTLKEDFEVF